MKKLVALSLLTIMMFSLAGCGLTPIDPYGGVFDQSTSQLDEQVISETDNSNTNTGLFSVFSKNIKKTRVEPKYNISFALISPLDSWDMSRLNKMQSIAADENIGFYQQSIEKLNGQIEYAQNILKNEKIGVLVISPMAIQGTAWNDILQKMDSSKTKIIAIDNVSSITPPSVDATLGEDYAEQAKLAASWINKNVDDAKIVVISEAFNHKNDVLNASFEESVSGDILSIEMSDSSRQGSFDTTKKMLDSEEFKELNVVFAQNDDIAIGAIEAIKESKKTPGKDVFVISIGGGKATLQRLKSGEISAIVKSDPLLFADTLMQLVQDVYEDKEYEKTILIPSTLIEKDDSVQELRESTY